MQVKFTPALATPVSRFASATPPQTPSPDTDRFESTAPPTSGGPDTIEPATLGPTSDPVAPKSRHLGLKVGLALAGLAAVVAGSAFVPITPATTVSQTRTGLEKHVDFFDRDGDGDIQIPETYQGLRAMHMAAPKAALVATVINGALGPATGAPWYSPTTIITDNIHLGKHGSDTGIYDTQGQVVPERVDQMFNANDLDKNNALDAGEIEHLLAGNKTDSGQAGARAEFEMLLELAGQPTQVDGQTVNALSRERFHQLYDGSLFYHLAGESVPQ
ncbi:MAG: caleosin family protein [Vulcanimicrobiota bacterium]